jgi:hypothetical protein
MARGWRIPCRVWMRPGPPHSESRTGVSAPAVHQKCRIHKNQCMRHPVIVSFPPTRDHFDGKPCCFSDADDKDSKASVPGAVGVGDGKRPLTPTTSRTWGSSPRSSATLSPREREKPATRAGRAKKNSCPLPGERVAAMRRRVRGLVPGPASRICQTPSASPARPWLYPTFKTEGQGPARMP